MSGINIFVVLVVAIGFAAAANEVTCGSAIKLRRMGSASTKYFLKSGRNNLHSSGHQVVTMDTRGDPSAMLWQIREAHNTTFCAAGRPIECGEVIRLTHVGTEKNLHSHDLPAPLSRFNGEVSAFGDAGEGDANDNWRVECLHREAARRLWESDTLVRFLHLGTSRWLSSSPKAKFNQSNCPNCPIQGELEVSGTDRNSDAAFQSSIFRADDGAYLSL